MCMSTSGFMWLLGLQAQEPCPLPKACFMLLTFPQSSGLLTGGSSYPPAAQTMIGIYFLRPPVSWGSQTLFTVFVWKDSNYTLSVWAPALPVYPPSCLSANAWGKACRWLATGEGQSSLSESPILPPRDMGTPSSGLDLGLLASAL